MKYVDLPTRKSILERLPEPYRTAALFEAERQGALNEHTVAGELEIIGTSFFWSETPQGTDYWSTVDSKLKSGEIKLSPPKSE